MVKIDELFNVIVMRIPIIGQINKLMWASGTNRVYTVKFFTEMANTQCYETRLLVQSSTLFGKKEVLQEHNSYYGF